jgi:hypothetical protein
VRGHQLTEMFPVHGMRATRRRLAIAIGRTHSDTDRAAAAAKAGDDAAIATIRPGVTFAEVSQVMFEPIEDTGGWNLTPLIHTLSPLDAFTRCGLGAADQHRPAGRRSSAGQPRGSRTATCAAVGHGRGACPAGSHRDDPPARVSARDLCGRRPAAATRR